MPLAKTRLSASLELKLGIHKLQDVNFYLTSKKIVDDVIISDDVIIKESGPKKSKILKNFFFAQNLFLTNKRHILTLKGTNRACSSLKFA